MSRGQAVQTTTSLKLPPNGTRPKRSTLTADYGYLREQPLTRWLCPTCGHEWEAMIQPRQRRWSPERSAQSPTRQRHT